MFRILCLFAGLMIACATASAHPQYSRVGHPYYPGQYGSEYDWRNGDPNGRVCCYRQLYNGYRYWWSTVADCARFRGGAAMNKACRKWGSSPPYQGDYRYQQQYQYNGYDQGYGEGYGQGYGGDPYGNPDRRVCCYRDGHAWWSSWSDCRRAWGQGTANKVCRR